MSPPRPDDQGALAGAPVRVGAAEELGVSDTLVVEAEVLRADEVDEAALGGGLDVRVVPSHAARQL